jgi:hypothetical protein
MKPGYRKLSALTISLIIISITGHTMVEAKYKLFLDAVYIITCGYFMGNAAGKFGVKK